MKKGIDKSPGLCYHSIRKKEKGSKKMAPIDLTLMTYHASVERADRFQMIENTTGWGKPLVMTQNKDDVTSTSTLTSTGVIVIRAKDTNNIITAFHANVNQAYAVWAAATGGTKMPRSLWLQINYNNNTDYWKKIAA